MNIIGIATQNVPSLPTEFNREEDKRVQTLFRSLPPSRNRTEIQADLTGKWIKTHLNLWMTEKLEENSADDVLVCCNEQSTYPLIHLTGDDDLKSWPPSGYAFKTGRGNIREALAYLLCKKLGLETYLFQKYPYRFEKAKIDPSFHLADPLLASDPSNRELVSDPAGLASIWVENEWEDQTPLEENARVVGQYHKAQKEFLAIQKKIDALLPKHDSNNNNRRLQLEAEQREIELTLDTLRDKLKKDPGFPNVQKLALIDILLYSCDSHSSQYVMEDGKAYCVDFSDFLPPAAAYKRDQRLFIPFRSYFIDHPACQEPICRSIQDSFRNFSIENLGLEKFVGDLQEYEKYERLIPILGYTIAMIEGGEPLPPYAKNLSELGIDLRQPREVLLQTLKKNYNTIRTTCLSHIHPHAFDAFISRLKKTQKLILDNPEHPPSILEIFHSILPEIATLQRIYEKYEDLEDSGKLPGEWLGYSSSDLGLDVSMWFAEIFDEIEYDDKQRGKEAIDTLLQNACNQPSMCLAIDCRPDPPAIEEDS